MNNFRRNKYLINTTQIVQLNICLVLNNTKSTTKLSYIRELAEMATASVNQTCKVHNQSRA